MSAWAIVRLFEPLLLFTTLSGMRFFSVRILMTCFRIDVSSTKLLTTFPTPRLTTTGTNVEIFTIGRKSARKNVITRIVF